jgi:hypothetical protein
MAGVVAPETPSYVPPPETQANRELIALITCLSTLTFLSQWTLPTFLSLIYPRLPPQKIGWLLHNKRAVRCRTMAFSMLLTTGLRLHRSVDFLVPFNTTLLICRKDRTDVRYSRYPFFEGQRRREEDLCGEDEGGWFVSRLQT